MCYGIVGKSVSDKDDEGSVVISCVDCSSGREDRVKSEGKKAFGSKRNWQREKQHFNKHTFDSCF